MKKYFYQILFLFLVIEACQQSPVIGQSDANQNFRVLGYLPSSRNWSQGLEQVDFSKITDLNLAFINPDADGKFTPDDAFRQITDKAHSNKVRVFLSLGGGSGPPHLAPLMAADKRSKLVADLVDMAVKYNFDGIDVDIENDLINADYAPLVYALAIALKAQNKLMTAALASWNNQLLHDSTIQRYDFINIMSYDKTGPWNLNRPGQHSPFFMVENDFRTFNQTRNIPANKLLVGLPFYGYGFGPGAPSSRSYKDVITQYPGSESADSLRMPEGGNFYYNGMNTIKQKTNYALANQAAGVMIWQLLGDSRDDKSLLKVINDAKNTFR